MKKLYIFALVAAIFAACTTDAIDEQSVKVEEQTPETLTVSFEDDDSRIQLNEAGKTVWTEGDLVSVFYRSNANQKWQYQGETGERTGTIKRVANAEATQELSSIVVAYPYSDNYYINPKSCNIEAFLPAEQSYLKESYGLNGNIMVSQSEFNQFSLKNVCGWLKIQLTGNGEKVRSIALCGNNGEQVAGLIYINSADATSTLASKMGVVDDSENSAGGNLVFDDTILTKVTLNCGEGITLGAKPTAFFIGLPPQTFENGVKVIVKTPYNIVEKSTSNSITITRNSILPLKSIDISDFENSGGVKILRTHYEGADISIKVPERIKQQNRRIKWGVTNIAILEYNGQAPIPAKLHSNDQVYPAFIIKNDTTLNINHYNAYRRNAQGEIAYYYLAGYNPDGTVKYLECSADDPKVATGEAAPVQYYHHFQPGEPLVLMMSEVDYADGNNKLPTIDWDWGPGWYWYPYDYAAYLKEAGGDREEGELPMPGIGGGNDNNINFDKFWYEGAWYRKIEFRLPEPEKFETGSVTINTSGLKTDGGKITFTPTGDTYAFFATIVPHTSEVGGDYTYLLKLVNNDPSLLQWLTTSELAPYLGISTYYETTIWNLEEILYDIQAGMTYHVIVNAVPGKMENGDMTLDVSKQAYQHITFKLPEQTLDEPELAVTAYE